MAASKSEAQTTFAPEFAQLGPVVRWLRDHGLSRGQLGSLFGESVGNVGIVAYRGQPIFQRKEGAPTFGAISLGAATQGEPTFEDSEPVRQRREARKVDQLEQELETLATTFASEYRFAEALAELNRFRAILGRPKDTGRLRLLSRWQYHRTWFLTNCGLDASAIRSADLVFQREAYRYRVSGSKDALRSIAAAALLATNSYLARNEPARAGTCLCLAKETAVAGGQVLDSAYYYQLGAVHMRGGLDEEARKDFETARRLWQERAARDVSIIGTRQLNLLHPVNFDRSQEVLALIQKQFPTESLEFSINLNWTAACAFSTDSTAAHQLAAELLEKGFQHTLRFGSQSTRAYLLRLAPSLPQKLWPGYVRFVLSQNAFRNS